MSETAAINTLTGEPVGDSQLKRIAILAQTQLAIEDRITALNAQLELAQADLYRIQTSELPNAMIEVGMESFSLTDGTSINIIPFYAGKIPDDKAGEAFQWLRDNNFDSIIKRDVKLDFGKGEDEKAKKLIALLLKNKFAFKDKQSVHPQTMKAFIREQIEGGKPLPTDLFGVHVGKRTKITPPSK